jgi:hypothetical protein
MKYKQYIDNQNMTTNIEGFALDELIERRDALGRYINELDKEIAKRKEDTPIFNVLTSGLSTKKITTRKIKLKKTNKKKDSSDEEKAFNRKIKATADDMKEALKKDNIKFKASFLRDELEELIRQHNLVRVSEKISKERKIKK